MRFKKFMQFFIVAALAIGLMTACNDTPDPGNTGGRDNPNPTVEGETQGGGENTGGGGGGMSYDLCPCNDPTRDLGGAHVILGNWWQGPPTPPTTQYAEDTEAYRNMIQEKHNFTIVEERIATYDSMPDIATLSFMSGDPAASIFTLDSSDTMSMFRRGVFYPLSDAPSFNPYDEKWNQLVVESMTFDDVVYGFAHGYEPRGGVFFNKNVLEEAGIDPESIYDHQAANTWTWDVFNEMCRTVTRDTTGNGEIDVFGITAFHTRTLDAALASNNARYVGRDADGRFFNASLSNEFLEAAVFVHNLAMNGFVRPEPDGVEWNWFIEGFNEGNAAFRIAEEHSKSDLRDVSFDWGFVFFPRGPQNDRVISTYRENIRFVPANGFTPQEVDDILFAFDLFTERTPGWEDDEMAWKYGAYPDYRDLRAVDETLAMMSTGANGNLSLEPYIIGFQTGRVSWDIWNPEYTPMELIEGARAEWESFIDAANVAYFG
ncbi:MAG: extracellular solute-binding protein [Oscillospiraceae bacterium]|nr:extracellular solute-binding protein [Oscillospiraceae bacterium]